jgi:hypothetical protein
LYVLGTLAYLVLVNCMLYKAVLEMSTVNWICTESIIVSIVGTLVFIWGYSYFPEFAPAFYNVGVVAYQHGIFWLVFITVPIITGVFDLLVAAIKTFYFPDPLRIAMEIDYLDRAERQRDGLPDDSMSPVEEQGMDSGLDDAPEASPTLGTASSGDNVAKALKSKAVGGSMLASRSPLWQHKLSHFHSLVFSGTTSIRFATTALRLATLSRKQAAKRKSWVKIGIQEAYISLSTCHQTGLPQQQQAKRRGCRGRPSAVPSAPNNGDSNGLGLGPGRKRGSKTKRRPGSMRRVNEKKRANSWNDCHSRVEVSRQQAQKKRCWDFAHALLELAAWLQAGEDCAIAAGSKAD